MSNGKKGGFLDKMGVNQGIRLSESKTFFYQFHNSSELTYKKVLVKSVNYCTLTGLANTYLLSVSEEEK